MTPTVLLVEADSARAELVRAALDAGMRDAAVWVRTLADAIHELDARAIACVVLDLQWPDGQGLAVLDGMLAAHVHVPVVALGGSDDGSAIEAVRRGAQDHLSTAELAGGMLGRSVAFAIERARNQIEIAENREHYRSVLEAVGEGVIVEGADGRIRYANCQAARILGRGVDEVLGWAVADALRRAVDVLHRRLPADQHPGRVALRTGTPVIDVTMGLRRPSGELQWIEVNAHPLMKSPGTPPYAAVIALRDITERKQSQEAMRQLSALVESSGDSIVCTTLEGTILTWNAGAERLHGYRADEVIGSSAMVLADGADSVDVLLEAMRAVALGESLTGVETTRRHKDGHSVHVSLTISPILGDDSQVTGCSFIGRDITARIELQRALAHQAVHDSLTGLPNRTLLVDRLEMALARARRNDRRVAVYFLDLDEFKLVNDGLGHLAGDQLLVEVAHRLLTCVRPDDTVARFGGDEFVIVCDSPSPEVAAHLGDRMLEVLRPPIPLADAEIFVTASIGLVIADRDAIPEEVLRDADSAMYRAKERGRARVELFDRSLHDLATWKLQSAADLRRALERDELRVFYQPILDLDSGQPAAVEALLRWQHPALGLVSPELFIPLAEETGMIVPIGRWVLEQALRDRAAWEVELPGHDHLRLAVNLSGRQLSDLGLVDGIADTLCAAQVDPGSVILEVTETVLMRDPGSLSTLQAIHDLGISLHVDDFGTGYSSLSYLKTMPIDAIKIDRSFTDGLSTDPDDEAIVTAVVALARALELEVIAEGLETPAQLQALRELGCDHGQGFLFARPMPADQLTTWLSSMPALAGGRYEAAIWPLESLAALSVPHV